MRELLNTIGVACAWVIAEEDRVSTAMIISPESVGSYRPPEGSITGLRAVRLDRVNLVLFETGCTDGLDAIRLPRLALQGVTLWRAGLHLGRLATVHSTLKPEQTASA